MQAGGSLPVIIDVDVKRIERLNNPPSSRNSVGLDYMRKGMVLDPNGGLSFIACSPSAAGNVSPQLALSSVFRGFDQINSSKAQQKRDESENGFSRPHSKNVYIWSLLSSIVCLWIAWGLNKRSPIWGTILVLYSILGFVCRFDLYSLILTFGPFSH
jgi:hypothetical protein